MKHIAMMDLSYSGTELTIVTATGHDEHFGLPGVGSTQRLKQDIVDLRSATIVSTGPDPANHIKAKSW